MCRKRHPCSCPGGCASRRVPTVGHFRHRRFGGTRRTERDVTGRLPVLTKTLQSRDRALVRRAVKARCPHSYRSGRDGVFPAGRTCPCAYCYWIPSKTATPGAHGASRGACLGRRSDSSRPAGFPRRTAPVQASLTNNRTSVSARPHPYRDVSARSEARQVGCRCGAPPTNLAASDCLFAPCRPREPFCQKGLLRPASEGSTAPGKLRRHHHAMPREPVSVSGDPTSMACARRVASCGAQVLAACVRPCLDAPSDSGACARAPSLCRRPCVSPVERELGRMCASMCTPRPLSPGPDHSVPAACVPETHRPHAKGAATPAVRLRAGGSAGRRRQGGWAAGRRAGECAGGQAGRTGRLRGSQVGGWLAVGRMRGRVG